MKVRVCATSGSPSLQRLGDFFGELERVGQHMLIVLDEFDHSLELFKLDEQAFKYLRHMAANFISLTLVTASRRSIFDIHISTANTTKRFRFLNNLLLLFIYEQIARCGY